MTDRDETTIAGGDRRPARTCTGSSGSEETEIVGGNQRPIQRAKVRKHGWTKVRRRRFLATLAETCNVRMAVEAAGMGISKAYYLRDRDPEFAALWQRALAIGYERLEEALLRHALASVNAIEVGEYSDEVEADLAGAESGEPAGAAPGGAMPPARPRPGSGLGAAKLAASEVQTALAILNRHRASVEGRRPAMHITRRRTPAETDALLRNMLDRLAAEPDDAPAGDGARDGNAAA